MNCPHCHAENQNGLYCAKCGKPLDESVSDLTRVMPPLEELHEPSDEAMRAHDVDTLESDASDEALQAEAPLADDDAPLEEAPSEESEDAESSPSEESTENVESDPSEENEDAGEAVALIDIDTSSIEEAAPKDKQPSKHKKLFMSLALIGGITLAALAGVYLFTSYFGNEAPIDPSTQVKNADTIAPDTSLAEDAIVGHWRHYNTGSVIEKIGSGRYRWTIEDEVYQLDFKDNKYIYEDENGSVYVFVMASADRIQLAESKDIDGGLISNPVFESGYIAGRVGQDGNMTKNMSVNVDAFNIVGRTYADLAGTYGPGSLSVVGDEQYIIFRAAGGNFAVQFTGETVPLKKNLNQGYKVVHLTNTTPVSPNTGNDDQTTPQDPNSGVTTPPTNPPQQNEDKEYKVEIPNMPTFPSNSAIATGVVWADLGFVINNAPQTMTVNDLSAVLGITLEVGQASANASGFNFYGMSDGYFAGTYGINDHSFYISGYGKNALAPDKTILFIQQIS